MTGEEYERLFRYLVFRDVVYRRKLRHPDLGFTLYFNRSRTGLVYFTGYKRDAERYPVSLWERLPPQQEKDKKSELITVRPLAGRERVAFETLLGRSTRPAEVLDDEAESALRQRSDIGPTEVERLTKARRGQGTFRDNVIRIEGRCRVTGVADPALLVASHIKPWRDSTDAEKLDGHNGLLLAPHVDHLFDAGYISFSDEGDLLIAAVVDPAVLTAWGLRASANVGPFTPRQQAYLAHHRAMVFRGTGTSGR